jgi:hypothetical protein
MEREITAQDVAEEEATTREPALENAEQAPEGEGADPGAESPDAAGRAGNAATTRQAGL